MVRLARWVTVLGAVVGCVVACGGTEFTAGTDGGANPNGQGDDGGASGSCVTAPSTTQNEADFCSVEAKLFNACKQCEACRQTDLNNCVALGDALSSSFKSALDACTGQIACGDYTTYAGDPCVRAKLAVATPSAAQTVAKTQYCAKCGLTTTECTQFFQPAQVDGGAAGIGYLVLLSSDEIATSIETACSADCGPAAYQLCAITEFCKTQGPDACGTGFCGK